MVTVLKYKIILHAATETSTMKYLFYLLRKIMPAFTVKAKTALVKGDPMPNNVSLQCHTNNEGMISRNPGQECECYSVSSKIRVLNLQIVFQIFLYEIVGYL